MNLITIRRKNGLAFDVQVGGRRVTTDMSPADGGQGAGFTPAELLAGALGACVAATVQGYCDKCGAIDGDVSVSLAFEFQGRHKRVGAVVVDVEMPVGVPEEKREEVRCVAEHAVICETLRHPPEVDVDIQFQRQRQSSLDSVGAVST